MDKFTVDDSMQGRRRREDGAVRCCALVCKWVLGLSLAIGCQCALAQAMYRIKPLGYLGGCTGTPPTAVGFNKAGEVAGNACNANGRIHAFLWKNNGTPMEDLGPDEVISTSNAVALNASGLVAGYTYDKTAEVAFLSSGAGTPMKRIPDGLGGSSIIPLAENNLGQLTGYAFTTGDAATHAFLWTDDVAPTLDLGTLGGNTSEGFAINASRQVAGSSNLSGNATIHAFVWKNDGTPMLDLGTLGGNDSDAFFINASGQVAGNSSVPGASPQNSHAFFWRNDGTPLQDLGTLGGGSSYARAFNNSGQIAGDDYGTVNLRAFVWMNDGTPMKDLGTLGGTASSAKDINRSGEVTGWSHIAGDAASHAFLWRNDGTKIQDLNTLIDPNDPLKRYVTLNIGDYINNHGDIVAQGTDRRTQRSALYLLHGTVLTLAPRSLAFANQPINASSAAKPVTVTNTSSKIVTITGIALAGAASGQFASTNNCGASLAGHGSCTIQVTFRPTTMGAKSAFLKVNGGGGGLLSVHLAGTGT